MSRWLPVLLLPWLLVSCSGEQRNDLVLERVAANLQKDTLVAEARLTPEFVGKAMAMLSNGESLLVSYHFELLREKQWLPDPLENQAVVRRRLRRNLILERYEMNDLNHKTTSYTADEGEAALFLGNPRFIPLLERSRLQPQQGYLVSVTFRLDEEGISRMLRVLRDWIFFWEVNSHTIQSGYRLP
ncbi:MAG: DUF4390 domain-containing protein [Magnetococcales bacterium]|nr:DUF4390 domain-containing protein [Magnetococcales bacterium]NGZ26215.1 DUF4390 domain-containing protein [Magnetococcales bacterium]